MHLCVINHILWLYLIKLVSNQTLNYSSVFTFYKKITIAGKPYSGHLSQNTTEICFICHLAPTVKFPSFKLALT